MHRTWPIKDELLRLRKEIEKYAIDYGLDFYPVVFDVFFAGIVSRTAFAWFIVVITVHTDAVGQLSRTFCFWTYPGWSVFSGPDRLCVALSSRIENRGR